MSEEAKPRFSGIRYLNRLLKLVVEYAAYLSLIVAAVSVYQDSREIRTHSQKIERVLEVYIAEKKKLDKLWLKSDLDEHAEMLEKLEQIINHEAEHKGMITSITSQQADCAYRIGLLEGELRKEKR